MLSKLQFLTSLLIIAFTLLGSSCFFKKFGSSEKFNVMGLVTHEKEAYSPVEVGSIRLSSEEIIDRQNFSGTKTTFLWGLFSYTDY
jgi:hypothetical protein